MQILETNHKKIGIETITGETLQELNSGKFKGFIKVLYLAKGAHISIDFKKFPVKHTCLFFVNSNQYFEIHDTGKSPGTMIFYNRDFYCVQIHDAEVACDGLLFNNVFDIPKVELSPDADAGIVSVLDSIREEFNELLLSGEEMIRTYLKQMIIKATRLWRVQHTDQNHLPPQYDMEFFRTFSRLIEIHFKNKHSLSDYAELLSLTPKTLNKKLSKLRIRNPNEIIKARIVLEAKRLLTFSSMNIKEIAYHLGYDDPAYFNRLFTSKVNATPASFRKQYKSEVL